MSDIISNKSEKKISELIVKKNINEIIVFTDGSCSRQKDNKQREFLSCGYGVYYPNKELPNVSRPYKVSESNMAPTNNRAELQAIYVALIQVKKNFNFNKMIIYSDSQYCIKSLTEYAKVWELNGWKTATKKPVENQDLIKPMYDIIKKNKEKITFIHVRAHTNKQDALSVSNDMVDRLAKMGADRSVPYATGK